MIYFIDCFLINPEVASHSIPPQNIANPVHPIAKADILNFDPEPKKLYRKHVYPSTKSPNWHKLQP